MKSRIIITVIVLVILSLSIYSLKDEINLADFATQLSVGLVLLIPLVIIWWAQPIIKSLQGDSEFRQKQKMSHSRETLCRIFEHLCSIEVKGNDGFVLAVPIPLNEYYKAHEITDILTYEYMPKTLESIDRIYKDNEHNYTFVPISDNPMNVELGLNHLKDKKYSDIFSHYTNVQEKCKVWNSLYNESKTYNEKIIKEKITNKFFENKKIPDYVQDQIKYMIIHAIMMNYSIYHKQVSDVCRITQEEMDSKQLHEAMNKVLQDNIIITQREQTTKIYAELYKSLEQFKTELKKLVMETRDGVMVKGTCKGCA